MTFQISRSIFIMIISKSLCFSVTFAVILFGFCPSVKGENTYACYQVYVTLCDRDGVANTGMYFPQVCILAHPYSIIMYPLGYS